MRARFAQFGLELHPDKTRLLEFGRYAAANRKKRGQGRPETFDLLGAFGWGPAFVERVRRTLQAVGGKLRKRMHADKVATGKWLGQVLNGWLNYYAVPTSYRSLDQFTQTLKRHWLRTLRRRSQRDRHSWDALEALCDKLWPGDEDQTPMAGSEIRR